ncbi:hypothetical protein D3C74_240280 [compost metagenome]
MGFIFINKREKDVLKAVRALDSEDRNLLSASLKEESKKDSIAELRRALTLSHRKY